MTSSGLNLDEEWANQPITRAEAYMALSKMQRLILLQSRFHRAIESKNTPAAQHLSDQLTALSHEIDSALTALVKSPAQ